MLASRIQRSLEVTWGPSLDLNSLAKMGQADRGVQEVAGSCRTRRSHEQL